MNEFDSFIKEKAAKEKEEIPDSVKARIEETLAALPEKEKKKGKSNLKIFPKVMATAASFIFVSLFILPNISVTYAKAMEAIPVLNNIVKVVTIRNYFYSDDNHEMIIDVPKIEGENNSAADYINKDVEELTKILADRFNEDLEEIGNNGHSAIYVEYEVVTNTNRWFTLKIQVHEAAGSSNTYYKYYHIDKLSGKIVKLSDLAADDKFYEVIKVDIKRQMKNEMKLDKNKVYWLEDSPFGSDFVDLGESHNFYWNENGDIVIVFDKYEVSPGFMGTPEFAVSQEVINEHLNEEFRNIAPAD